MLRARAPRRPPTAVRRALTFWRRSIQARVVASTVILSAVVVAAVGWLLLQQTRDGLLENRVDVVLAEVADEVEEANDRLDAAPGQDPDATAQRRDLVDLIVQRGLTRGYEVVVAGPAGDESGRIADGGTESSPHLDLASVPLGCEEHFDGPGAGSAWTYTTIGTLDDDGASSAASRGSWSAPRSAAGRRPHLHPLLPVPARRAAADDGAGHARAVTAGGLLLVLIAGLTWLVTRQVVTPVRLARRVAERLAAGRLTERMRVTGEDDLARLATSFNQMATNLQRQIRQLEELSRVQRRFVSDVSHELRTPLTTVRMAGDVLHDARDELRPGDRPGRRAAPDRAGPVRDPAGRPAGDQPLRRRRGRARARRRQPGRRRAPGRGGDPAAGRAARRPDRRPRARPPVPGRGRRPPGRADRAQPGHQRHRPRACRGPGAGRRRSSSWSPATSRRPRSRSATTASAWRRGSRRWCSTASGGPTRPGPGPAAAPASACRSPWRTPTCTAAGSRPGAARRGLAVPADPAAAGRRGAAPEPAAAGARGRPGARRMSRARSRCAARLVLLRRPDRLHRPARRRAGRRDADVRAAGTRPTR